MRLSTSLGHGVDVDLFGDLAPRRIFSARHVLEPHSPLRGSAVLPSILMGCRPLAADDFHVAYLTTREGRWLNRTDEATVNERLSLLRAV